jgi:iron complex outermembrane receptor protein
VRGFNPQVAGNVRIEGLYFDQQQPLTTRVASDSVIRVGISESSYTFPAPSGVIDYSLRSSNPSPPGLTSILSIGPFGQKGASLDGVMKLGELNLLVPLGVSYARSAPPPSGENLGYGATVVTVGATPKWTPFEGLTVGALLDWQRVTDAATIPLVFAAGSWLPPSIEPGYRGQDWARSNSSGLNLGTYARFALNDRWVISTGVFRSSLNTPRSYADLYENVLPDGESDHVVVGYPRQYGRSTSGEVRGEGNFAAGTWVHTLTMGVAGRDSKSLYGGSSIVDVGNIPLDNHYQIPFPPFQYSVASTDRTTLTRVGLVYQTRQGDRLQWKSGIQKEFYEKVVSAADEFNDARKSDTTVRGYASLALRLWDRNYLYAGYTQGFEDSGVAPAGALNRGTILPVSRTSQVDAGIRYHVAENLDAIAGVFKISKPYFNLDALTIDRQLGMQQATGLELSLAGKLASNLHINAGALLGSVRIQGVGLAAAGVGEQAYGQPHNQYSVDLDYALRADGRVSLDLQVYHFGSAPASIDDRVFDPALTELAVGARYRFRIGGAQSLLRVQVQNATNRYIWDMTLSPGFYQLPPRTFIAYLIVEK